MNNNIENTIYHGSSPPENGEITYSVMVRPASLQASRRRRDTIKQAIEAIVGPIPYLLSGDVSVQITWHINEDERYETDEAADVDNIIKPILDALSGPDGIIVDDCQVQHVSCHWISRFGEDEHIDIMIKYFADDFYEKRKIMFVQLNGSFCMPLKNDLSQEAIVRKVRAFQVQLHSRDKMIIEGTPPYEARGVMSIQRPFHKSRLRGFKVVTVAKLGG